MSLRQLIGLHPSMVAVIFPIYFLLLSLLIFASLSFIGGWHSLAKLYRTQEAFDGAKWGMQSARMRWLTNYNHALTIGVNQQGLYLAIMFLVRFMHPPLLIPWSEIRVRRERGWMFEYVIFTMGHERAIPLRIRATLAAKLRESAGNHWPVEET